MGARYLALPFASFLFRYLLSSVILSFAFSSAGTAGNQIRKSTDILTPPVAKKIQGRRFLWTIRGTHQTHGIFDGQMELRERSGDQFSKDQSKDPSKDQSKNQFDVIRIANYHSFLFENLKVQEVWTGTARVAQNELQVRYTLKKADFIVRFEGDKRSDKDFASPAEVEAKYTIAEDAIAATLIGQPLINLTSQYSDATGELIQENLTLEEGTNLNLLELSEAELPPPIWVSRRETIKTQGLSTRASTFAKPILMSYFQAKVPNYWEDDFIKKFQKRREYKEGQHYFVFDPTDYDFYQKNTNSLRVVNKVIDRISLLESLGRQRAYSHSLAAKAEGFDQNYLEKHMTPQGLLADAMVDSKGNFIRFVGNGDGALWTGVYASAQAMKYLTLKESNPDEAIKALENVKKTVRGLFLLMDIQGDEKEFARTAVATDPANNWGPWKRGSGNYAHLDFIPEGNNDMVKGLFTGFLWAALTVPETDTEFWQELKSHSLRLSKIGVVVNSMNLPIANGIAALINKNESLKEEYFGAYTMRGQSFGPKASNFFKRLVSPSYWDYAKNANVQWPGYLDTSGIHLTAVTHILQILLAQNLGHTELLAQFKDNLMGQWVNYFGLQRHIVTLAAYSFSSKNGLRRGLWDEVSNRDKKWRNSIEKARWGLRDLPYPRMMFDVEIDHSKRPDWCISPAPAQPEDSTGNPVPPIEHYYQGLYDYPFFESQAWGNDYIWKSAMYNFKLSVPGNIEYSSADYLYFYWMARWSGFLSDKE